MQSAPRARGVLPNGSARWACQRAAVRTGGWTMNLAQVAARRQPFASQTDPPGAPTSLPGAIRPHIHPHALSRRRLLQLSAGGMAAGAMVGSRLIQPGAAAAKPGPGTPKPIPGGSSVIAGAFGQLYHVYGPGAIDPVDAEPATI